MPFPNSISHRNRLQPAWLLDGKLDCDSCCRGIDWTGAKGEAQRAVLADHRGELQILKNEPQLTAHIREKGDSKNRYTDEGGKSI